MQRVASQVAVAVDNALNFEMLQAYQQQLARERDRLQVLLEINNVLVTTRELPELFRGIVSYHRARHSATTTPASRCWILSSGLAQNLRARFPRPPATDQAGDGQFRAKPRRRATPSPRGKPLLARGDELDRYPSEIVRTLRSEGVRTICCVPLITTGTLSAR